MSILSAVVGLAVAAGFGFVLAAWGLRSAGGWRWPLALALAAPVGLAVTSVLFFLYAAAFSPGTGFEYYVAFEAVVLLAGILLAWKLMRGGRESGQGIRSSRPAAWLGALAVVVLVAVALSLGRFMSEVLQNPDGRWDAWITWNVRARFMYLGGEQWTAGFSPSLQVGHTEYPLLLPASVARLWFYAGDATRVVPVTVAFVFTSATIAAAGFALMGMNLAPQGLLAVFTLACAPALLEAGALQYADIPLGFFVCGSIILYCMHATRKMPGADGLSVGLGVLVGSAAWTKPEGISFMACFLAGWIVFEGLLRREPRGVFLRSSLGLAAGLLPFLICLAIFEAQYAGPSWLLADLQIPKLIRKLTEPERYVIIAKGMLSQLWTLGGWRFGVVAPVLLGLILGPRNLRREERTAAYAGAGILGLTAVSYFIVYVISDQNPDNLIPVSLGRLVLHLYPAFVFLAFYVVKSPLAEPTRLVAADRAAA